MKQFTSIEKIDTAILYALELTSSLSVLLLAFGLIASMANVLTKGSVLTDNLFMQQIWAWTQCIAIDASVAGTIIRTFRFYNEGEKVKTCSENGRRLAGCGDSTIAQFLSSGAHLPDSLSSHCLTSGIYVLESM